MGKLLGAALLSICLALPAWAGQEPLSFTDGAGARITLQKPPQKVVSLSPAVSEIIFALGAGRAIKGVTYHETLPMEVTDKAVVGGFLNPSVAAIARLKPDVIFLTSLQKNVREHFAGRGPALIQINLNSLDDLNSGIDLMGRIFHKQGRARQIWARVQGELDLIRRKVAKIPASSRLRVMRIMGRDKLMTPGDDSFQRQFIELAGGIPPELRQKGAVAPMSREKWRKFNPQVIYGCGRDKLLMKNLLSRPGWKEAAAIKNNRALFFPCDLTCRVSLNTGHFVSWLATSLYPGQFNKAENLVLKQGVTGRRALDLTLPYIHSAQVVKSRVQDFEHKTLLLRFKEPIAALSTLEGMCQGLTAVGNHYLPPPSWSLIHDQGPAALSARMDTVLGVSPDKTSLLFTGVDMANLAVERAGYQGMEAYALVTAGAMSNALRAAAEAGNYLEPGTINMIILTNRRLTARAMARAVITATEAKTAALQDLDVRSAQKPLWYQATGTGTDNMIIVQGKGPKADLAGGHSKLGELIAKAAYKAVRLALGRQNGLTASRGVFRRLKERGIELAEIAACSCVGITDSQRTRLLADLQELILEERYASLVEYALALSDARRQGQAGGLKLFQDRCREIAQGIAGRPLGQMKDLLNMPETPPALRMALNALLNGAFDRR